MNKSASFCTHMTTVAASQALETKRHLLCMHESSRFQVLPVIHNRKIMTVIPSSICIILFISSTPCHFLGRNTNHHLLYIDYLISTSVLYFCFNSPTSTMVFFQSLSGLCELSLCIAPPAPFYLEYQACNMTTLHLTFLTFS